MTGPALTISEKQFQDLVIQAAMACGFRNVYHTYDSRRSNPGFPDLVLVNASQGRMLFAELKSEKGRLSKHQKDWISALEQAGQPVYVWRPSDWDAIEAVLTGGAS